jgi:hypothetical protein
MMNPFGSYELIEGEENDNENNMLQLTSQNFNDYLVDCCQQMPCFKMKMVRGSTNRMLSILS